MKNVSRLVLGLALLGAPAFLGCSEESKPAADAGTPAPAPATPPGGAPGAPGGDAAKTPAPGK